MKKSLLWIVISVISISMIALLSWSGCARAVEKPVVEKPEVEVTEEEAAETETVPETKIPFGVGDPGITSHLIILTHAPQQSLYADLAMKNVNKYYPNITYELNIQEAGTLVTTMPAIVEGGEDFDLGVAWTGTGMWGIDFFTDKYCYDMTAWYKKYGWEDKYIFPVQCSAYKTGDKWYTTISLMCLEWPVIYNKGIFDEVGIEYPDPQKPPTLEQWYDMCEKIKEGGYNPFAYGAGNVWKNNTFLGLFMSRAMSDEKYIEYLHWTNPNVEVSVKWTDKPVVDALGIMNEMAKRGYFAPGIIGIETDIAVNLLSTKEVAMIGPQTWELARILEGAKEGNFEIGVFQMPKLSDAIPAKHAGYINSGYFVPKHVKTENLPAIETVLDYIFTDEGQLLYRIPEINNWPITNIPVKDYEDTLIDPVSKAVTEYAVNNGIFDQLTVFVHAELSDLISTTVQQIIDEKGQADVNKLAQDLQTKAEELREELKNR